MYDNGVVLNRYAAKKKHKLRVMKLHMPIEYTNFNRYISDMENHYKTLPMIADTAMKWHRSWWKTGSYYNKTAMKHSDHRRNRRMKRRILHDINTTNFENLDEINYINLNRFKDEENIYW